MKRLFTYMTLVLLAVVSCRKEPVVTSGVDAISFAAPQVAQTKSVLITDISGMKSGDNELAFSVFASRYLPSDKEGTHEQFMDNVKVTSTDGGTAWAYTGEYYWSPGACYKFFAVYPYYDESSDTYDFGLSFAIDAAEHAVKMTMTDGTNLCPDILYGTKVYDTPYSVGEVRGPIEFQMNHALAAVSFRLRNASEYTITDITTTPISGFKNGAADVLLSEEGPRWTILQEEIAGHEFEVPAVTSGNITSGSYHPDETTYWYTALMIPQNFASYSPSPSFTFTATMDNGSEKTYTLNFKDHPVSTVAEHAYEYLPGYHYVYNLNITAQKISCDVEIVPWIEDEPIELN